MQAVASPLLPRYHRWPERPQAVATVICEGPSAAARPEALARAAKGPVVAVNHAIGFSDRVPIDFWATTDDPRNLWGDYQEALHEETRLFSTENQLLVWRDLLPSIGRVYHWHGTAMKEYAVGSEPAPAIPTVFPVLAWLLSVGVREVRLLGCDMRGSGTPGINFTEEEDEGHGLRWAVERTLLALSMKQYRAKGARIIRWKHSK